MRSLVRLTHMLSHAAAASAAKRRRGEKRRERDEAAVLGELLNLTDARIELHGHSSHSRSTTDVLSG